MQRKRTVSPYTFLRNYVPWNFPMKIMSALQLKNRHRYFHETGYKNKLVPDNVQSTRTVAPPSIFVKLCPFEIFLMKILSAL